MRDLWYISASCVLLTQFKAWTVPHPQLEKSTQDHTSIPCELHSPIIAIHLYTPGYLEVLSLMWSIYLSACLSISHIVCPLHLFSVVRSCVCIFLSLGFNQESRPHCPKVFPTEWREWALLPSLYSHVQVLPWLFRHCMIWL